MAKITQVIHRRFEVPLDEVLTDAKHGDHTHFELITTTVRTDDGAEGTGYTYTGGKGGHAIAAMIEHDLAPFLIGLNGAEVEALYDAMQWHVHYVARGGIASFAISAVDIALWDLRLSGQGVPLWKAVGGAGQTCNAYGGGIDLAVQCADLPERGAPRARESHRRVLDRHEFGQRSVRDDTRLSRCRFLIDKRRLQRRVSRGHKQ